jgi:ATP-dependent Clp protease adaptor protein ClpS
MGRAREATRTVEPLPRTVTEEEQADDVGLSPPWITILWNCECHTFEQVAKQLTRAIGCSYDDGMAIAWRVHTEGKAVVRVGPRSECERVAAILKEIGLQVTIAEG